MACPNCNTPAEPVATPESTLSYRALSSTVTGRDGQSRRITQPLVDEANKGHGGWKVTLTVKGHTREVVAGSPRATFAAASALLVANEVVVSELDLWLNLNIQWIGRAVTRRQVVRLEDIMAVAQGNDAPVAAHASKTNVPPMVWGRKGWGMLQQELAQNVYVYSDFLFLATKLSRWLDPDLNPTTGCSKCFAHFTGALAILRSHPIHVQQEARVWLWKLMNQVNARRAAEGDKRARQWTFEEASTANHWT